MLLLLDFTLNGEERSRKKVPFLPPLVWQWVKYPLFQPFMKQQALLWLVEAYPSFCVHVLTLTSNGRFFLDYGIRFNTIFMLRGCWLHRLLQVAWSKMLKISTPDISSPASFSPRVVARLTRQGSSENVKSPRLSKAAASLTAFSVENEVLQQTVRV